jgi:hypothetical protein
LWGGATTKMESLVRGIASSIEDVPRCGITLLPSNPPGLHYARQKYDLRTDRIVSLNDKGAER